MNLGYTKDLNSEIDKENCPICGSNIYVTKYWNNYRCMNKDCALHVGANELIGNIQTVLNKLK